MMKQTLHWLVLALTHFLITRIALLVRLLSVCVSRFARVTYGDDLNKLPVHLALVLTEDRVSFPDVGRVVAWCMSLGIKNVTVYDLEGVMKSGVEELRFCLDAALRKARPSRLTGYVLKPSNTKTHRNGSVSKCRDDTCQVNILAWSDGKQDLVTTARTLAESAARSPGLETSKLTVSNLEDHLHSNCGMPCPDLLICCGETFTSIGFLPWHIHLTEIFYLPTHHRMSFKSFFRILKQFQNCQQRYGK